MIKQRKQKPVFQRTSSTVLWLLKSMPFLLLWNAILIGCMNKQSARLNYDPNATVWAEQKESSPLIKEFQNAHPNYRGFAKAFILSDAQSSGSQFSFTFKLDSSLLAMPRASNDSNTNKTNARLSLESVMPQSFASPSESSTPDIFTADTFPSPAASNPSSISKASGAKSTLKISFGAVGQAVNIDFQFADPTEANSWANYVHTVSSPLKSQEPAKPYLEKLADMLTSSSTGTVQFSFDYKEASVLTVFLWPCVENKSATKP